MSSDKDLEMTQAEPYHYVRFVWWQGFSVDDLAKSLKGDFTPSLHLYEDEKDFTYDLSFLKGLRWEIRVKADTLSAFLSPFRAVLFQRVAASFTRRDAELRRRVLSMYIRNRPTPFPWQFSEEPPFKVEES